MYSKQFIDLVNFAASETEKLTVEEKKTGNPYYVGFGNPNAKVLILGKEKGFEIKDATFNIQLEYESINNPLEWKNYIEKQIISNSDKFHNSDYSYINAFYPYLQKQKGGHTWTKYEAILKQLYPQITGFQNDFFNYVFISEVNYQPSKISKIKRFNSPVRTKLLKHDFFKTFPVIILGCGNYLTNAQVEDFFEVTYQEDLSKPKEKMIVFGNENRILVQTRQLSFDIKNEYLDRIAKKVISVI